MARFWALLMPAPSQSPDQDDGGFKRKIIWAIGCGFAVFLGWLAEDGAAAKRGIWFGCIAAFFVGGAAFISAAAGLSRLVEKYNIGKQFLCGFLGLVISLYMGLAAYEVKSAHDSDGKDPPGPTVWTSGPTSKGVTDGVLVVGAGKHGKIGQRVQDGEIEFVVRRVECGRMQVGSKIAQGQFCQTTMSVRNIGKEQHTFGGSTQKATVVNAGKCTDDGAPEKYVATDTQMLNEINPGNQVTAVVLFDIPKDKKMTTVELHDSSTSGGVVVDVP